MINGLEGIPGSGKSYEAVVFHVLPTLEKGRRVITNLPLVVEIFAGINPAYLALIELRTKARPVLGSWDATRVDDQGNGNAFEVWEPERLAASASAGRDKLGRAFSGVWDFYSTWKHPETGQGPVFIIDECHVPFPSIGTDPEVVEWFKLHRHFNADVLLMTQRFRDMNQPIAALMAMLVVVRKGDILGTPKKYIRKVKGGYRGAVISTEERPYQPQYFALYRSHTQGNSVAESLAGDVTPFLVKFKRYTRIFWAVTIVACVGLYYFAKEHRDAKARLAFDRPAVHAGIAVPGHAVARAALPGGHLAVPALAAASGPPPLKPGEIPDPYASKGVHLTGVISMGARKVYTFAVSDQGAVIGQLTDAELLEVGYQWKPLMHCAGTLFWHGKPRSVTCDAPSMARGSTDAPVVQTISTTGAPVGRSDGRESTKPMGDLVPTPQPTTVSVPEVVQHFRAPAHG